LGSLQVPAQRVSSRAARQDDPPAGPFRFEPLIDNGAAFMSAMGRTPTCRYSRRRGPGMV